MVLKIIDIDNNGQQLLRLVSFKVLKSTPLSLQYRRKLYFLYNISLHIELATHDKIT
jgi:hypothetical protein